MKEPVTTVTESYLKGIERKVEALELLTEFSTIISSALDLNVLMPLVMEKAKDVMDAEACSILFYNRETNKLEFEVAMCEDESAREALKKKVTLDMGQGIAGWVAQNLEPLIIKDVSKDQRFFSDADKTTGFKTESIIAVPLVGRSGLIGVAEILNPRKKDYDLEIFGLLCKQFAIAIENALFHRESIERERMKHELEIAAVVQQSFLPPSPLFRLGKVTVSAVNISAKKVGGDIYDFIEPVPGKVGVLIGDVSGKGISAALYMAKFISDFRYVAHGAEDPKIPFNQLNKTLASAPRGMFLTACYAVVDVSTGEIRIVVAGHPPPLLLTHGEVRVMTFESGPPLGILSFEYPSSPLKLGRGDRLYFVTDGVFDAKNKSGERIGFDDIISFIKGHMHEGNLVQKVVDHVQGFSSGMEQADDLTMVEVSWGA